MSESNNEGSGQEPAADAPKVDNLGRELLVDPAGRTLALRPADDMLLMMDVLEAAGLDAKGQPTEHVLHNPTWLGNAHIACQVASIDGVPEPFPRNLPELRALVGKVGRPTMNVLTVRFNGMRAEVNPAVAKN
jgi:hypothetical protein